MVSVMKDHVSLVPTTFEWAEDIDAERVAASERRAREVLKEKTSTATDIRLAEARLKRALVRKSIVQE
jgi:F-type H+-transporting ATPase subunit epsilon